MKFNVELSHTGPFDEIVGEGGMGFTITDVVPTGPAQLFTVAITEYTPEAFKPAFVMMGF